MADLETVLQQLSGGNRDFGTVRVQDLIIGKQYTLKKMRHVNTKYGVRVVATLNEESEFDVFLPPRYSSLSPQQITEIPGNFELVYNGMVSAGNFKMAKITFVPVKMSLEKLGITANQHIIREDWLGAISVLDKALSIYPADARLLNNTCMCYSKLQDYERCLTVAEVMTSLHPQNVKGYFWKGESLYNLKRFKEAEEVLQKVILLNSSIDETRELLWRTQINILCEKGIKKEDAVSALLLTKDPDTAIANIEDAEQLIRAGAVNGYNSDDSETFYSDEEDNKAEPQAYDKFKDPSNPFKVNSLWVGCISENVTEEMIRNLFSPYGRITSIYVYHSTYCAFINYADNIAPGKAMKALQGKLIGGKNIIIKFPDRAATKK